MTARSPTARPRRSPDPIPALLPLAVAAALLLPTAPVHATALGPVVEQSALGQPLRIVIDLNGDPGENADANCFAIAPVRDAGDGLATVRSAQMRVERTGDATRLVVTTLRPVNDLALRVAIETTCTPGFRREYTVLLDPPLDGMLPAPPVVALAEVSAPDVAPVADAAPAPAKPRPRAKPPRTEPPPVARSPAPAAESPATPSLALPAAPTSDRVVVSRITGVAPGDTAAVEREFRKLRPDAQLSALQEHETVLSQRVLELSKEVQAMQAERIEQLTAQIEQMQARLAELETKGPAPRAAPAKAVAAEGIAGTGLSPADAGIAGAIGLAVLAAGWFGWRGWQRRREARAHAFTGEPSILSAIQDSEAHGPAAAPVAAGVATAVQAPAAEGQMPAYTDYLVLGGVPEEDAGAEAGGRPHPHAPRDIGLEFDEELAATMSRRAAGR